MRSAPRLLASAFVVAMLFGVLAPAASARRAADSVEAELLQRLNDARVANGRAPLAADVRLAKLAGKHSTGLARTQSLTHAPFMRLIRAVRGRTAGEVIAVGGSPAAIVQAWMASAVHRPIILARRFTMSGVGVAPGTCNGAFAWYVTVDVAG